MCCFNAKESGDMMSNIAIVGATGAVGRQLLELLEEREFSCQDLHLFASERSVGEFIEFNQQSYPVQLLEEDSFVGIDLVFFCTDAEISRRFCPCAAKVGAMCVDLSAAWRLESEAALVVPEVNAASLPQPAVGKIVSTPNSLVTMLSMALNVLQQAGGLKRVVVSTYQAVSMIGMAGVDELRQQSGELLNGRPTKVVRFPQQVGFNCVPQIGAFDALGDSDEERSVIAELRKVLDLPQLPLSVTAVQVPVFYGHSCSLNVELANAVELDVIRQQLAAFDGIELVDDDGEYPMPIDAAGQDEVYVGRLRPDPSLANAVNLWLCGDNLRRGAALNAVRIAEKLLCHESA